MSSSSTVSMEFSESSMSKLTNQAQLSSAQQLGIAAGEFVREAELRLRIVCDGAVRQSARWKETATAVECECEHGIFLAVALGCEKAYSLSLSLSSLRLGFREQQELPIADVRPLASSRSPTCNWTAGPRTSCPLRNNQPTKRREQ